jgi:DNA invertase Pin-like site-specific DNA recombinase
MSMANGRFVVYYRVSTGKQKRSGLGLQAQRDAVAQWLNGGRHKVVAELQEIESGRYRERPQLAEALRMCRVYKATLLVAKQDRLSRNAAQILEMLDRSTVPFVCVDDPNTTRLNVGIKALIAEDEAEKASVRTKAALAVARANGKQLGGQRGDWCIASVAAQGNAASAATRSAAAKESAQDLMPVIEDIREQGITTLSGMAAELNERGIKTPRGGEWSAVQVMRILQRGE